MAQPASVRNKYASVNLNSSYGKSSISSSSNVRHSSKVGPYGNMLVLGKARGATSIGQKSNKLALPKPVNLPSLKKEHAGNDPTITLVAGGGSGTGWIKQEKPEENADILGQETGIKSALSTGSTWGGLNPQGEALSAAPSATSVPSHAVPYVPPTRSGVYTPPAARGSSPAPQQYRTVQSERQPVLKKEDFPTLQAAVVPASVAPQKLKDQQQKQKEQQQQLRDQQQKLQELSEQQHGRQQSFGRGSLHESSEPVVASDAHQHTRQQANAQPYLSSERSGQVQDTWRKQIPEEDGYRRPIVPKIEPVRNWADDEREGPSQSLRPQSGQQSDFFDRGQERGAHGFHRQQEGGFGRGGYHWNGGQGERGFQDDFKLQRDRESSFGRRGLGPDDGGRFRQGDRFGRPSGEGNAVMQDGFRSHGGRPDFSMPFAPRGAVEYDRRPQHGGFGRFPVPDPFLRDFVEVDFPRLHNSEFRRESELRRQVPAQEDFRDPIKEAFDAELERVQRLQEEERQRKVEEKKAEEEKKKREIEELERQAREEVERVAREEQEAQEAIERARREAEEVARRLEEERRQIQDEKKRLAEEEERRKENARRKLQELEERMARREVERKAQEAAAAEREEARKEEEHRAKQESGARRTRDDVGFPEEEKPPKATFVHTDVEKGFPFGQLERPREVNRESQICEPKLRSHSSDGNHDPRGSGGVSGERASSRLPADSWSSQQSSETANKFQPGFGPDSGSVLGSSVLNPPAHGNSSDLQASDVRDRVLKGPGVERSAWGSPSGQRMGGQVESVLFNDGQGHTAQPVKERWRNVVEGPGSTSKQGQSLVRGNGLTEMGKEVAYSEECVGIGEDKNQSMAERDSAKNKEEMVRSAVTELVESGLEDLSVAWPARGPSVLPSGQESTGKELDVKPALSHSQESVSASFGERKAVEPAESSRSEIEDGGNALTTDSAFGQPHLSLVSDLVERQQAVSEGPMNSLLTVTSSSTVGEPVVCTPAESSFSSGERSAQSPASVQKLSEVQQTAQISQKLHPQLTPSQMGPWQPVSQVQQQQPEESSSPMQFQAILGQGIPGIARFGSPILQRPSLLGSLPITHQILPHHQQQHAQQQVQQSTGEQAGQELQHQSAPQISSHGVPPGSVEEPLQTIQFGSLPVHLPQTGSVSAPPSHALLPPPSLQHQHHPMHLPFLPFAPHFVPSFGVTQPYHVSGSLAPQKLHAQVQPQEAQQEEEKQMPTQTGTADQTVAESILSAWENRPATQSSAATKRDVVEMKPVIAPGPQAGASKLSGSARGRKTENGQKGGREIINGAIGGPKLKSAWTEADSRERQATTLDRAGIPLDGFSSEDSSRRDGTLRNGPNYGIRDSSARQVGGSRGSIVQTGSRGQGSGPGRGGQVRGTGRGQGNRNRQIVDGFGGASGAITSEVGSDGVVLRTRVRVRGFGGRRGFDGRGRGNAGPGWGRTGKVPRQSDSDGDRGDGEAQPSPCGDVPIQAAEKMEHQQPEAGADRVADSQPGERLGCGNSVEAGDGSGKGQNLEADAGQREPVVSEKVFVAELRSGNSEKQGERAEKQSLKVELDETTVKPSLSPGTNAIRQEKKTENSKVKKTAVRALESQRVVQHLVDEEQPSGVVRVFEQLGIVTGNDDDFIEVRSKRQLLNDKREQREKELKAKKEIKGLAKKQQERGSGRKSDGGHAKTGDSSPSSGQITGVEKRLLLSPGSSNGPRLSTTTDIATSPSNLVSQDRKVSSARKDKGLRGTAQPRAAGTLGIDTLGSHNPIMPGMAKPQLPDVLPVPKVAWGDRNSTLQVVSLSQGKQLEDGMKPHKFDIPLPVPSPIPPHFSPQMQNVHSKVGQSGQQIGASDASPVSNGGATHPFQFGNIQFGTAPVLDLRGGLGIGHIGTSVEGGSCQPEMNRQEDEITFGKVGRQNRSEEEAVSADAEAEAEAAASAVAVAAIGGDDPVTSSHQRDRDDVAISLPDDVNTYPETVAASSVSAGVSSVGMDDSMAAALPADLSLEPAPVPMHGSSRTPHSSGLQLQIPHPTFLGPMGPIFQLPFGSDSSSQGGHGVDPSQSGAVGGWPQQQQQQTMHSVGLDSSFFGTNAPAGFAGPPFISHPGHGHQNLAGIQPPQLVLYPSPFGSLSQFAQPQGFYNFVQSAGKQPDWKHTPSPNQASGANPQLLGASTLNATSSGEDANSAMAVSNSVQQQQQRGTAGGHSASHRMGTVSTPSRPSGLFDPNLTASYQMQSGDSTMQAPWSHIPQGLPSHSAALAYGPFMHARPHGHALAHPHVHAHVPPHVGHSGHGSSEMQSGSIPLSRYSVGLLNVAMSINKPHQGHVQASDAAAQFPEELGLGDLSSGPSVTYGQLSASPGPSNRAHSGAQGSQGGPHMATSGSNGQKQQGRRNLPRARGSSGGNSVPHGGGNSQQSAQQQMHFQQRHYQQSGGQQEVNGAQGNARGSGMHTGRRGSRQGAHGHHGLEQGMRQAPGPAGVERNSLGQHSLIDKAPGAVSASLKVKQVYMPKPNPSSRGNHGQSFSQGRSPAPERDPHRGQLQGDVLTPMR